ncbi:UNVERIFIED_CONTAM: hypothetical protein K2H54_009539 [Gekko kuhli]
MPALEDPSLEEETFPVITLLQRAVVKQTISTDKHWTAAQAGCVLLSLPPRALDTLQDPDSGELPALVAKELVLSVVTRLDRLNTGARLLSCGPFPGTMAAGVLTIWPPFHHSIIMAS